MNTERQIDRAAADRTTKVRATPGAATPVWAAVAIVMAAVLMSACGVRGPLEPPGGKVAADGTATKSADSASAGENSAAKPKPHEGFVLDGLLR